MWVAVSVCSLVSIYFRKDLLRWIRSWKWNIKVYEFAPIAIILFFLFVIGWRASYYPPYSYDARVGIDLIAKYAVLDAHINGSLFTEILPDAGHVGNQLFYAPFTMLMQVLYMLCGITFGQMWLGVFAAVYFLFFYVKMKTYVHPIFAGFATVVMLCAPEVFSYAFVLQTDFVNAAFFFIGVIYLYDFVKSQEKADFWVSAIGFAFACWSRTETIFFVPIALVFILFWHTGLVFRFEKGRLLLSVKLMLVSALAIALWNVLYLEFYLPDLRNLTDEFVPVINGFFSEMVTTMSSMFNLVVRQRAYWNYLIPIFGLGMTFNLISSLAMKSREGFFMLVWIFFLFLVFAMVIVEFPSANVPYTFRRGFFKFVPLLMAANLLGAGVQWLSRGIIKWENA